MAFPSLTICIAVYNGAERLPAALDSVFNQSYQDFKVLVLDDGSKDNSAEIAARYPVRVERQANTGLGGARKAMVEMADTELIAFLDDDDQWTPNKLEVQIPLHVESGAVLSHTGGYWVYPDGRRELREIKPIDSTLAHDHVFPDLRIMAPTVIFDRAAMLRAGNFVPEVRICSDWYGWSLLANEGDFLFIDQPLLDYARREGQNTSAGYRFYEAERFLIEEKFLKDWPRFTRMAPKESALAYLKKLRWYLGENKGTLAWFCFTEKKDRKRALQLILGAIRLNPSKSQNYRILQKILTTPNR